VETIRKIQRGFGDDAMGITQIKEWYNRFKDGRTSEDSDAHSGRPSTSRNDELIDQVRTLVMQDRRVTVRKLAEEVGISTGSVHSFFFTDDLAIGSVREIRAGAANDGAEVTVSGSLAGHAGLRKQRPRIPEHRATGDESWVYGYDPENKAQSTKWKHSTARSPPPLKKKPGKCGAMSK